MRLVVVCLLFFTTVQTRNIDDLISKIFGDQIITKAPNINPDIDDLISKIFGDQIITKASNITPDIDDLISKIFEDQITTKAPTIDPAIDEFIRKPDRKTTRAPNIVPGPSQTNIPLTGCPSGSQCVPYYLCKNLTTDGASLIDIDGEDDATQQCPSLEQCCVIQKNLSQLVNLEECGFRNPEGIRFRTPGGTDDDTLYGEFPWMVAIWQKEQEGNKSFNLLYKCGASIVSPRVVLTAAHCVDKKPLQTLKTRAGEWNTRTEAELLPHQDRNVAEVAIHPDYNREGHFNDIALLFLDVPFELAENVQPICLPPTTTTFDGVRCFVTGWGTHTFGGKPGQFNQILKKLEAPIVPRHTCQAQLRKTRLGDYFILGSSFICAGGEPGRDICKGDGGSPLVCPIPGAPDRYYQAGIGAWHSGCGESRPALYASVEKFRSWIDEQLARTISL